MNRLLLLVALLILCIQVQAQECYAPLRAKGDAFAKKGQYEKAINMYLAAMNCPERELGDNLTAAIQTALDARVRQLEQARKDAIEKQKAANRNLIIADNAKQEAFKAHKQAEQKAREALANDFIFKSQIEQDRATAFRLAEHAHRIDPDNPKVLQRLIEVTRPRYEESTPVLLYRFIGEVKAARFSPDGKQVLTCTNEGTSSIWETGTGKNILNVNTSNKKNRDIAWAPDGRHFAIASGKQVEVYETESGERIKFFSAHHGDILSIAFSPDGKSLATSSTNYDAKLWDVWADTLLHKFELDGTGVSVQFSVDGKTLLAGDRDTPARMYNLESGEQTGGFGFPPDLLRSASMSPDDSLIILNTLEDQIQIFKADGSNFRGFTGRSPLIFDQNTKLITFHKGDNFVRIFDVISHEEILRTFYQSSEIIDIRYSEQEDKVLTLSKDGIVRIWPFPKPGDFYSAAGTTDLFTKAIYDKDGGIFITAEDSYQAAIKFWERHTGKLLFQLTPEEGPVKDIDISNDGKYLVSVSGKRTLTLWDLKLRKSVANFNHHDGHVVACWFSSNDSTIVSVNRQGFTMENSVKQDFGAIKNRMRRPYFGADNRKNFANPDSLLSPDGNYFLFKRNDKIIDIYPQGQKEAVSSLDIPFGIVSANWSPDGNFLLIATQNSISEWDWRSGKQVFSLPGHTSKITFADISPDGREIITGSMDHTAIIWDSETLKPKRTLPDSRSFLTCGAFSGNGKYLVTGSSDNKLRLYDLSAATTPEIIGEHLKGVTGVTISSDGSKIASSGGDGRIKYQDRNSGFSKVVNSDEYKRRKYKQSLNLSPDGEMLILTSTPPELSLFRTDTFRHFLTPNFQTKDIGQVGFSPDSKKYFAGNQSGVIGIWGFEQSEILLNLFGHKGAVTSVRFSSDGSKILSGSKDRTLRVWDSVSGKELLQVKGENGEIVDAFFHPQKPIIYAVYPDKIQSWWLDADSLINEFTNKRHVPHLTPNLYEKYSMIDSFDEAGMSAENLIAEGDEQLIHFVAVYLRMRSLRMGAGKDIEAVLDEVLKLIGYLNDNGKLHSPDYFDSILEEESFILEE